MSMEYEVSERGFKHLKPITDKYLGIVRVYESSAATEPCLWVSIDESPDAYGDKAARASSHLTLDKARELRDQLDWLIENHYQGRPDE